MKNVLSFIFGVAIGVGGTYVIMNRLYSKALEKEQEASAKDANEVRDYYKANYTANYVLKLNGIDVDKLQFTDEDTQNKLKEQEVKETKEETEQKEYHKLVENDLQYNQEEKKEDVMSIDEVESNDDLYVYHKENGITGVAPYIISPEEYGYLADFESLSYVYLKDGILLNEDDQICDDVDFNNIGDALDHFGEYADDAVYMRNEDNMCEYEILKIDKTMDEYLEHKYSEE